MRVISSSEFRNNMKKYLDSAMDEKIVIQRGKNETFVLTKEEYLEPDEDLKRAVSAEELLAGVIYISAAVWNRFAEVNYTSGQVKYMSSQIKYRSIEVNYISVGVMYICRGVGNHGRLVNNRGSALIDLNDGVSKPVRTIKQPRRPGAEPRQTIN